MCPWLSVGRWWVFWVKNGGGGWPALSRPSLQTFPRLLQSTLGLSAAFNLCPPDVGVKGALKNVVWARIGVVGTVNGEIGIGPKPTKRV